jgi:hypothetical protein
MQRVFKKLSKSTDGCRGRHNITKFIRFTNIKTFQVPEHLLSSLIIIQNPRSRIWSPKWLTILNSTRSTRFGRYFERTFFCLINSIHLLYQQIDEMVRRIRTDSIGDENPNTAKLASSTAAMGEKRGGKRIRNAEENSVVEKRHRADKVGVCLDDLCNMPFLTFILGPEFTTINQH